MFPKKLRDRNERQRNMFESSEHDDSSVILRIIRIFQEIILRIVRNMANFILRLIAQCAIMVP